MARLFDDGQSEYLENANAVADVPMALVAWVNLDATIFAAAVSLSDGGSDFQSLIVRGDSLFQVQAASQETAWTTATATANASQGAWHHAIAMFVTSTDRRALIDGGNKGTNTVEQAVTGLNRTSIGRTYDGASGFYWSGLTAEAAIYNLSAWPGATDSDKADEFERIAAPALAAGMSPDQIQLGLVAYWRELNTDQDLVGGYDMTAYNSPTWADHPPKVWYSMPQFGIAVPAAGGPTNYPVSLSLARQAGLADGAVAAAAAAVSLARQGGLADGAVAAALGSSTLARQAGISQGGQAAATASTTLARQGAISEGGAAAAGAGLTVSIVKAAVVLATAAALGDATLSNVRGISQSATAAAAASFTATIYRALGITTGITASLTLARTMASAMAATAVANANASLAEVRDLSVSGAAAARGGVDLSRVLEAAASALAAASATVAVARSLGTAFVRTEGEAAAAVIALTLISRDLGLTLEERSLALMLVTRALGLTLPER